MSPEGSGTPPKRSGNAGYHPKRYVEPHDIRTPVCAIAGKIPPAPLCQRGSTTHGGFVTADHVYESCVV